MGRQWGTGWEISESSRLILGPTFPLSALSLALISSHPVSPTSSLRVTWRQEPDPTSSSSPPLCIQQLSFDPRTITGS
ncbi:hypothetical protein LY76DRAFT_586987 [Colletotrichum caudatum]|nr:hypothetical protein LY76DRAFT_586987 [Colletotrichum caudatum]